MYGYDPEIHDEDSVFFRDTYTGPSERDLMGGCNRCGGMDDCYCPDPPTRKELRDAEVMRRPTWSIVFDMPNGERHVIPSDYKSVNKAMSTFRRMEHNFGIFAQQTLDGVVRYVIAL